MNLIRAVIKEKGLSQAKLASFLGCSKCTIQRLETNRSTKLTLEKIDKMAELVGMTRIDFLKWGESLKRLNGKTKSKKEAGA